MARKVAVVPVQLFEVHPEQKRAVIVGETITRKRDGYFELITPSIDGKYSVGLRIEKVENCPPQYKHPPKKREPKTRVIT